MNISIKRTHEGSFCILAGVAVVAFGLTQEEATELLLDLEGRLL